jgi:SepF-like predicted cell division protein (DUF552 family)
LPNLGKSIEKFVNKLKGTERTPATSADTSTKVYLRALPLRTLDDVEIVKREVKSGNILILRISPLAKKSIEDIKRAVDEICEFTKLVGGDIARLGEERVVVTPSSIQIWREKTPILGEEETPTAA